MYIFLILILGLCLRLINIDKPEGLWNDEYVSWFVASTPFFKGFWNEILKQCHMPLYYLYLKPFTNFSDLTLRLTSLVPGVISIWTMYKIGNFFSQKTAKFCAVTTAILPFLIYYSQEVRFYSLLFFLTTLSLYYLVKILQTNKGYLGYFLSVILILLTHVLGSIYVFFATCYLLFKKNIVKPWLIAVFISLPIIVTPFAKHILAMLPQSQWWGTFSYTNILFLFSDFLSPILTNNVNAPPIFFYSKNLLLNFFLLIPTLIGIFALILGIKNNKGLTSIAFLTVLVMSIIAKCGLIVFITKYSIEILPIIILLISIGFSKNKITNILCYIFILLNLLAFSMPFYPSKTFRTEGHKLVADIIEKQKPDKILYTYYDENRFKKYLTKKYPSKHISKINRFEYLNSPKSILNFVNKNETVSIIFLESVSFIPEQYLLQAKVNNIPEMFITFSIIKHSLMKELTLNYKDFVVDKQGSWLIIKATKFK